MGSLLNIISSLKIHYPKDLGPPQYLEDVALILLLILLKQLPAKQL